MLQKVLDAYREAKVDMIVVVLGAHADDVREKVELRKERVVVNSHYEKGMSGSIKAGLAAVAEGADAALIALGDQPYLRASTINAIVREYRETRAPIVVPVYHGQRGNPVLFDRRIFPQIMKIEGDAGAKSVVQRNETSLREVAVEDQGILFDIDTPADYASTNTGGKAAKRRRSPERV